MLRLLAGAIVAVVVVVDLAPPLWVVARDLVSYAVRMIAG